MDFFNNDKSVESAPNLADIKPLADRIRPRTLAEFVGQEKIVGPDKPLRKAIEADQVSSAIFWGPPGSGKTTLAALIARATRGQFVHFSAVITGIKEVKEIISKAGSYYQMSGRRTYVFIDEIHRFNKSQQDAFLPYVEKGDIVLIGATTENPSFEVNSALMSRLRVYVLERLSQENIAEIISRAVTDTERGLGEKGLTLGEGAIDFIASAADGDARRGLSLLEAAAGFVGDDRLITVEGLREIHQRGVATYDKAGEGHYNLISALHKSLRGGDPDASLYWLARMLDAGEDPMYIIRRMVRFASEDIGLADPYALTISLNARDAYHFLGSPEGELAIAQAVVYMACAAKSNASYIAFGRAMSDASQKGSLPVPLWIRNAPTRLMKSLGYGKDYKYAHEYDGALTDQEYFPEELAGTVYFQPKNMGREIKLGEYLAKFREFRKKVKIGQPSDETDK